VRRDFGFVNSDSHGTSTIISIEAILQVTSSHA
jgi:hypothetical protein